jgi:citrate lyase beta subunit
MFKKIKEYREAKRTWLADHREIAALNDELVDLMMVPIKRKWPDYAFYWKQEKLNNPRHHHFLKDMALAAGEYEGLNAVLSAGIWGNWNAIQLIDADSVRRTMFRSADDRNDQIRFRRYKDMMATAAIHFADGSAFVYDIHPAVHKMRGYREYVAEAKENLIATHKKLEER